MPVSFSSPPRNLFLLGSSGADVVSNFFAAVDGVEPGVGFDVWIPDEIKISDEYASGGSTGVSHFLAGTAQDTNSKKVGWVTEQRYFENYPTGDPNNPPSNVAQDRVYFINEDTSTSINTTLRAMELFGSNPNHVLIVVGKTGSVPWIAKYNENDVIEWVSTSNTANVEYTGVCKGGTNYYACGSTAVSGDAVSFVEKFDSNGIPGWGKSATMLGRDVVLEKITANSRDEIIAVGYLEDDTADKGYIVKIDANSGEILWDRSLERNISGSGGTGDNNDEIASADVRCTACYIDGNDQIYVVGSIDGKSPVNNGVGEFLVKYSPEGNILWQRENHTDHYTAIDSAPNMIPFDVKSDTDTQQTVVLSVEDQGSFASNNSDIFISKYSKDGTLVFRRKISKGSNTLGNASLDADPSFYYVLFTDQQTVPISGTPDRYFFGRVSTSGNGLGNFQYDDGSTIDTTPIDYTIVSNENKIGRLSDGSVRNDISDFITYPFTASKLVFDDLATPVSNKKKQMDSAGSFVYGGSPAVRPADNPILSFGSQEKTVTTTSGPPAQGQQAYTTAGTYTWTAPANVTSVSIVCVGGGSGSGGALAYKNNIPVVPGTGYTVIVGAAGVSGGAGSSNSTDGGDSSFADGTNINGAGFPTTIAGGGKGQAAAGGAPSGDYDGGGNGGDNNTWTGFGGMYNGAGAGGYSGDGGDANLGSNGSSGSGGGGGGGGWAYDPGGGVGILGEGASGAGGAASGSGGSGGQDGQGEGSSGANSQTGGNYGGGMSSRWAGNTGGSGAVRLIWGPGRAFPSTLTTDQTPSSGPTTTTTTSLIDITGNGFDGVVDGAIIGANSYWTFDGVDDLIVVDDPQQKLQFVDTGSDFAIECWVRRTAAGSGSFETMLSAWGQNVGIDGWIVAHDAGSLHFTWAPHSQATTFITGGTLNLNTWYHIMVTKNGNAFTLYLNGVSVGTGTNSSTMATTYNKVEIGHYGNNANSWFTGNIGEVRIYPRGLTAAAVFQNYNATKSKYINQASTIGVKIGDAITYNGLVLHYDFSNKYTYDPSANFIFPSNIGQNMLNDSGRTTISIDYSIKDPFGEYGGVLKCEHTSTGGGYFRRGRSTPLTAGKTYTISLYFKNGTIQEPWEGRATINGPSFSCATFNPTFESPMQTFDKNTPVGNGWYKQIFTFTPQYSQTYQAGFNISHNQTPLGIWYLAGFQFEEADTDGRFIPTKLYEVPRLNIVRNLSSSSYNGTINGATFNSDGYFEFDGSDDGISVPDTNDFPFGTNDFTIEFWGYMDSLPGSGNEYGMVGQDGIGSDSAVAIYWKNDGGTMKVIFRMGGLGSMEPAASLPAGQWIYCACGRRSGTTFVNVNGVDISTSSGFTGSINNSTNPFYIGRSLFTSRYLDGRIGEVRVYNRGLFSSEVSVNYLKTKSKYGL